MSMGTVIRHPVDHSADDDDSEDGDEYEPEEDELESELKALKEDFEEPASQFIDIRNQTQQIGNLSMGRPSSAGNRPGSASTLPGGSLVGASSLSSKRSRGEDPSPRASKAVRFNRGENLPEKSQSAQLAKSEVRTSSPETSDSGSESDSDSDSGSDSDSSSDSSDDDSTGSKAASSSDEESEDEQSNASSSSSSDSSSDDSSSEEEQPAPKKARRSLMAPPGHGTIRTKKSNNRYKLRRRLSKLKEIGVLPDDADFNSLRTWEEENGGWHFPEGSSIMSARATKEDKKEQHQKEFEAKRQQLLRDLAACGIDVEGTSEKENVPPRTSTVSAPAVPETIVPKDTKIETAETERSNRRTLDVESSRRLLFGSLGVRTPKTKEDEEATIKKLAAQASKVSKKPPKKAPAEQKLPIEEDNDDSDVVPNWQDKLIIRATECVVEGISLTAPPFPFQNRWDPVANAEIRERLGWNKKRKRRKRIQVYDGGEEEYDEGQYGDGNEYQRYDNYEYGEAAFDYDENGNVIHYDENGDVLQYDEEGKEPGSDQIKQTQNAVVDDLPVFPNDPSSVADLEECEAKPGAIIAFRQLDMSKETNWQPRMSEYRVAEVQKVDKGTIHVRLAVRDWKPKQEALDPEDDEPRQYSGFEMPGFDDEEGEDDGLRELAYAELSDPKLLKPALCTVDDGSDKEKDKDVAQEDSMSVN